MKIQRKHLNRKPKIIIKNIEVSRHSKFTTYFIGPATLLVLIISLYLAYKSTFPKPDLNILETKLLLDDIVKLDSLQINNIFAKVKVFNNGNKTTSIKEIGFLIHDSLYTRTHTKAYIISYPKYIRPGYSEDYIFKLSTNILNKKEGQSISKYNYPIKHTYKEWRNQHGILKKVGYSYNLFLLKRQIEVEVAVHLIDKTIIENTIIDHIIIDDIDAYLK